jgi:hypothetical protein
MGCDMDGQIDNSRNPLIAPKMKMADKLPFRR